MPIAVRASDDRSKKRVARITLVSMEWRSIRVPRNGLPHYGESSRRKHKERAERRLCNCSQRFPPIFTDDIAYDHLGLARRWRSAFKR